MSTLGIIFTTINSSPWIKLLFKESQCAYVMWILCPPAVNKDHPSWSVENHWLGCFMRNNSLFVLFFYSASAERIISSGMSGIVKDSWMRSSLFWRLPLSTVQSRKGQNSKHKAPIMCCKPLWRDSLIPQGRALLLKVPLRAFPHVSTTFHFTQSRLFYFKIIKRLFVITF